MSDKGTLIWWVVAIRIILIGPFFLLAKIGEKFELIADWLDDLLPHPFRYATKHCPVCGGAGGGYHFFDKQWEDCSRCDGKGRVKNV